LYQGNDIKEVEAVNEQDCQDKCKLEPGCLFWTLLETKCQLKHFLALQNRIQRQGAVSGTANCPGKAILILLFYFSSLLRRTKKSLSNCLFDNVKLVF
jgi:hypothetical protein